MRRAEATRTELDTAVGVLMGRRHCSAPTAFAEIAEAVRQTGIGKVLVNAQVDTSIGRVQIKQQRLR